MQLQRTTKHTPGAQLAPKWHVVDARGQRLGRLASDVARVLQGKHSPNYSAHELTGDFVVVINAADIGISGNKLAQKIYYRHTGYVGHLKQRTLSEMLTRFPERVIERAVKGMLPRNRLARRMLRRLKVYATDTHPHEAQLRAGTGARAAATAAKAAAAALAPPSRKPSRRTKAAAPEAQVAEAQVVETEVEEQAVEVEETQAPTPKPRAARTRAAKAEATAPEQAAKPARRRRAASTKAAPAEQAEAKPAAKPARKPRSASSSSKTSSAGTTRRRRTPSKDQE